MTRSTEERATNDAIEDAINAYREAFRQTHPDATHGTIVDWIVVAAETKPNMEDSEEDITAYTIIMPNGGIPWYRARGLMEAGVKYLSLEEVEEA